MSVYTTETTERLDLHALAVATGDKGTRLNWLSACSRSGARSTLRKLVRLVERASSPSSIVASLCRGSYLRPAVDVRRKLGPETGSIGMDKEVMADEAHPEDPIEWLTRRFAWEQELDRLGRQGFSNSSPDALPEGSPLSGLIWSWIGRPQGPEPRPEPALQSVGALRPATVTGAGCSTADDAALLVCSDGPTENATLW
jgi:hypothetical protein